MIRSIPLVLLVTVIVGCTTARPTQWETWLSEPTPESWKPGSTWTLILVDQHETIIRSMTVRFTEKEAKTCIGGEWKVLEVLAERPPRRSAFLGRPAYWTKGSAMMIDLTANICDAYTPLRGRLTSNGVTGEHGTEHMFGGEVIGTFYGAPVQ